MRTSWYSSHHFFTPYVVSCFCAVVHQSIPSICPYRYNDLAHQLRLNATGKRVLNYVFIRGCDWYCDWWKIFSRIEAIDLDKYRNNGKNCQSSCNSNGLQVFRLSYQRNDSIFTYVLFIYSNNVEENEANAESLVREAAAQGAQIILLQELFQTLYFCQVC